MAMFIPDAVKPVPSEPEDQGAKRLQRKSKTKSRMQTEKEKMKRSDLNQSTNYSELNISGSIHESTTVHHMPGTQVLILVVGVGGGWISTQYKASLDYKSIHKGSLHQEGTCGGAYEVRRRIQPIINRLTSQRTNLGENVGPNIVSENRGI